MKTLSTILSLSLLIAVGACGDDDDGDDDDDVISPDAMQEPDAGPPAAPTLGAQIDRAGRPAISSALIGTFAEETAGLAAKDVYNANGDPSSWVNDHAAEIAAHIAILDSLDTVCGNQLLAAPEDGGEIPQDRYAALAGVLATDMLWVNGAAASCGGVYLAVEADATGALVNNDCGGRTLEADVIRSTYSVLSGVGLGLSPSDPDDGIAANDVEFSDSFPYLASPQSN